MSKIHAVELVMTCKSWQEAQNIADALLERTLVNTVETVKVATNYVRRHTTGHTHDIKLILQTTEPQVAEVKRVIRSIRNQNDHPPFVMHRAHMLTIVTKWLRGATEVKSVKLKR